MYGLSKVSGSTNLGRFGALLVALTITMAAAPFFSDQIQGVTGLSVLYTLVLLVGIYASSHRMKPFLYGLVLAVPALASEWISNFNPTTTLVMANMLTSMLFVMYVTCVVSYEVIQENRVTADTLAGGITIYLLIAVGWVLAYAAVEYLHPGSFLVSDVPLHELHEVRQVRYPEFIYFSVVTMTTLGFGDMIPATPPARMLAAAEALVGQIFLTVFVARLVGLHLAGSHFETR